jgi:hypothetical protein
VDLDPTREGVLPDPPVLPLDFTINVRTEADIDPSRLGRQLHPHWHLIDPTTGQLRHPTLLRSQRIHIEIEADIGHRKIERGPPRGEEVELVRHDRQIIRLLPLEVRGGWGGLI